MKTRKEKRKEKEIIARIMTLFIISLLFISTFSSLVSADLDDLPQEIEESVPPQYYDWPERLEIVQRTKDLSTLPKGPDIPTPEQAAQEARELKKDIGKEQESWRDRFGKIIPCSGSGKTNAYDCVIDIAFTALSVIRGIWMSVSLVKIKGSCSAEEPLKGLTKTEQEEACKSCNEDPFRICTEERCTILGNCIPIAPEEGNLENLTNYLCVPGECEETGAVAIETIKAGFYAGGELTGKPRPNPQSASGDKLTVSSEVAFNADSIKVEITTDRLAQCRYSFEAQQKFEDMLDFDDNYFPGATYDEPDPQEIIIPLPGSIPRNQQHTIYIKCKNVCGEAHDWADDNHYVRFKFEKKPDQLPPIIVDMDPENFAVVSGDISTFTLEFRLDENGYCKYSDNWTLDSNNNEAPLTTEWQDMIHFQTGNHQPESAVLRGECRKNQKCEDLRANECTYCYLTLDLRKGFTNLSWEQLEPELQEELEINGTMKFFHYMIRCADDKNNVMVEEDTLDYNFFTMPPYTLKIENPESNEMTYDIHPLINVTSDERNTECRYAVRPGSCIQAQYPGWDDMTDIDGTIAKQHLGAIEEQLVPTVSGNPYCMYVRCKDKWLLERKEHVFFKVVKDVKVPIVIRMYHDLFAGDYLLIETNEDATCVYGADDEIGCNYLYEDGNEMTGTNETIHTAYWTLDHLYYIRCRDIWGNVLGKGQCTVILNPFEVPAIPF